MGRLGPGREADRPTDFRLLAGRPSSSGGNGDMHRVPRPLRPLESPCEDATQRIARSRWPPTPCGIESRVEDTPHEAGLPFVPATIRASRLPAAAHSIARQFPVPSHSRPRNRRHPLSPAHVPRELVEGHVGQAFEKWRLRREPFPVRPHARAPSPPLFAPSPRGRARAASASAWPSLITTAPRLRGGIRENLGTARRIVARPTARSPQARGHGPQCQTVPF